MKAKGKVLKMKSWGIMREFENGKREFENLFCGNKATLMGMFREDLGPHNMNRIVRVEIRYTPTKKRSAAPSKGDAPTTHWKAG